MNYKHFLSGLCSFIALSAGAADYYVATDGDDANPGTMAQPFASLGHALLSVVGPGDTVYMRGGTYHEEIIGTDLLGTDGSPITITSYNGEQVTLDGSESLADLGGANWSVYSGNIYTTTINKDIWQLWVDGRMGITARWPNANTHPCDPIEPQLKADGYSPKDGSWWDLDGTWGTMTVYPADGKMQNNPLYQTVPNVSFNGGTIILNYHSESTFTRPITSHQAGSDMIEHVPVINPHDQKPGGHYLVEAMSALDMPGEWYYNKNTGEVRLWCEDGQTPQGRDIRGKTISCALDFQEIDYVEIRGIDFFGCTVNFVKMSHSSLDDCVFDYPSYFPRMLGIHSYAGEETGSAAAQPPQYGSTWIRGSNKAGEGNIIRDCVFRYSDGPIEAKNNDGTLIENCLFEYFSFSGMAQMVLMSNGSEGGLTQNCTFRVNGSKVMQKHSSMDINMSRASHFGYLQQDGCAWQSGGGGPGGASDGAVRSYLWHYQAFKTGTRWDGNDGVNGTDHHEVSMLVPASHNIKGDYHRVLNNVSVALHDPTEPGMKIKDPNPSSDPKNQNTDVYNNLASGISSDTQVYVPLTGNNGNNWNGYVESSSPTDMAQHQLRDPLNLDFRPKPGAEVVDAGIEYPPYTDGFLGSAPDIGAYEFGDTHYWIPGYQGPEASSPVPPNGTASARASCDLMWLAGKEAVSHDIYFGTESGNLTYQGNQSLLNNIFDPNPTGDLAQGQTYYWRVDTVTPNGTIVGDEWAFTVSVDLGEISFTDFIPLADTYVKNSSPTANYGHSDTLSLVTHTDGSETEAYIKFNVNVTGAVVGAELHLYSTAGGKTGNVLVHAMDDTSWQESVVTWNTKPGYGALLDGPKDIAGSSYSAFNVLPHVSSTGLISFAIDRAQSTSTRAVSSREHTSQPFLRVFYSSGEPDLPPATPSNLVATDGYGQVALDWDDNTEPDLAGYQVMRREHDEDNFAPIHPGLITASQYIDSTGAPDFAYGYAVRAQDSSGQWSYRSNIQLGTNLSGAGNNAPVFTSDPVVEANAMEDTAYSGTIADNASDVDNDPLSFGRINGPSWLDVDFDGTLSGTPANADVGLNSWTIQVLDGTDVDFATLEITVVNVNDIPLFSADPINAADANEDTAYSGSIAGSAADVDIGDTLTYSKVSGPAWLSVAADGALSGTPGADDTGVNMFIVKVEDGALASDTATLNITVIAAPVNQPPAFSVYPINETDADEGIAYGGSIAGLASDPESDPMTFSKVDGPDWLGVASDGVLSGTPSAADVGLNVFTVQVDAEGGSDMAILNINVIAAPVNLSPAFNSDPLSEGNATENEAYSSSIADDASDPESDPMTFSKVSGPAWLSVASDGTLSGIPGFEDIGLNSFSVQVDALGGSDTAVLEITVDAAPAGWTLLNTEDFESGWGIWNDAGSDCRRSSNDSTYAHGGTYCVRIRDNTSTSRATTDNIDLTPFADLKIEFWFTTDGLASGDKFDVKVRDANNSYNTVARLVAGTDFNVGDMTFKSIEVSSSLVSFDSDSRVRFECESPSNSQKVYIDDVSISAK